eukprot:752752-Hanusia_phi.AAC.2
MRGASYWGRADADEGDIVDEVSVRRDLCEEQESVNRQRGMGGQAGERRSGISYKAALVLNANSSCSISELRLHEDLPLLASLHPDDPLVEPWNHLLLPHLLGALLSVLSVVLPVASSAYLESNGLASLARVVKDCS